MPTTKQVLASQFQYWLQTVTDAWEISDDPWGVHQMTDAYRAAALAMRAERRGPVHTYTFLVRLGASGQYEAFTPGVPMIGCEHTGTSTDMKWAKVEAVQDHQRRCLGR